MKILFDIGHPAHVHYSKNLIKKLKSGGNTVYVFARNKDVTFDLLEELGIEFLSRGRGSNSVLGKLFYLLYADLKIFIFSLKNKVDLFVGFGSPYASQVSFVLNKKSIICDDTENAKFIRFFYKPFASCILSPSSFSPDFGRKHYKFNGFMELSYLAPQYFSPNVTVKEELGINNDEKICIIRFVSWQANHDLGHTGISLKNKTRIVEEFSKYARVFITSEASLPPNLEKYKFPLHPSRLHHAMAFADLVFGESATMASESAVLGTYAIYLDNVGRGYTNEQEDIYGLVFNYTETDEDQEKAIFKGIEILKSPNSKLEAKNKSQKMLREKIDVTDYFYNFVLQFNP